MVTITVKNIPEELYERFKLLAAGNRRSINSEMVRCIERAVGSYPVDIEATLDRARAVRERTAAHLISDEDLNDAKASGCP